MVVLDEDPRRPGNELPLDRVRKVRQLFEVLPARFDPEELHRSRYVAAHEQGVAVDVGSNSRSQLEQRPQVEDAGYGTHVSSAGVSCSSWVQARGLCPWRYTTAFAISSIVANFSGGSPRIHSS